MLRMALVLPLIILLLCTSIYASPTVKLGSSIEDSELGELEDLARDKYNINLKELISEIIKGDLDFSNLTDKLTDLLIGEVKKNSSFMSKILLICILNGILASTMEGFAKGGTDKIIYFASYTAVASMLVSGFKACINTLVNGIEEITEIINAGIPLILCIATAAYGGGTALSFGSVLSLGVGILNDLISKIIVPQIIFCVMLGILNCLWDRDRVGRLSELFAFLSTWEIRLCAFIFVGSLTLSRMGTASALAGKGVRLAVGAVPVVGGLFENSLEAVVSFIDALKGGAGAVIIIIILFTAIVGLAKLCIVMLMFKLTAALSEPIGSKQITQMIDCAGEGVKLLIGVYFTVAIMFITALSVMLAAFN